MAHVTFFDRTFEVAEEIPKLESYRLITLNLGNPAVVSAIKRRAVYTSLEEASAMQDFLKQRERLL